jgi:hypothetical protein
MRAIFSLVSLVVVLGGVGLLAKKQLTSQQTPARAEANNAQVALPVTTPGATAAQQSQQIQAQVKTALVAAMQQARPVPDDK